MKRLYDFECSKCGKMQEMIVEHDQVLAFCGCHGIMNRMPPLFKINRGPVPSVGYYDDNLECGIRTNNHRKEVMRQKGVSERGATPKNGGAWV